jgi:DNA-binding MarR family transcriptional regulator
MSKAGREVGAAISVAVILHLGKVWRIIERRAETVARRAVNLSLREVWVVLAASSVKPLTQKQIAKNLGLNQNAMVLLLDKLERSGHVQRSRNPDNRREQFVRLTTKGGSAVRTLLENRTKHHRAILAPLEDDLISKVFEAAQAVLAFEATRDRRSGGRRVNTGKRIT